METNFVILPSIEEDIMSLREEDAGIESAAQRYIAVQAKSNELLARAEDRFLSGSPGTIYLKKLGHRPLTSDDFQNLINALGTEDDKKAIIDFAQAQRTITERLKTTKVIGFLLEQAEMPRDLYYKRTKRSDLWKAEEILTIMNVLDRLHI